MREGVIADHVSRLRHSTRYLRVLPHEAADHKKRRPDAVSGQHVKQLQSVGIVRSVIEGKSDLLASPNPGSESTPKPLAGWRHGLIAGCGSSRGDSQSDQSGKHEEILAGSRSLVVGR
jgi:hypothetical protein